MVVGGTYAAYKQATDQVVDWIQACTKHVLEALRKTSPDGFEPHAQLYADIKARTPHSQVPPIRVIDAMLNVLADPRGGFSPHKCPSFFDKLPSTLSMCLKAIHLRTVSHRFYQRTTDKADLHVHKSNKKHRHFIEVMKVWREKLKRLWRKTKRTVKKEGGTVVLAKSLSVLDISAPEQLSSDEDQSDEEDDIEKPQPTCTDLTIYGMHMEEENLDDFDDIVFVLQCLMFDLDEIMKTVAKAWLEVRNGQSNFVSASIASLLAFRRVKELTRELETQFPEIQSFEDFETALMQLKPDPDQQPDLSDGFKIADKLLEYHGTRVYPDGSLFVVMRFMSCYLRTFTSAIPTKKVKLILQTGFFGPPYDEMTCSVTHLLDFARFLLEHLPLVFNEHLTLVDFFVDYGVINFSLFEELLNEFKKYFEQGCNCKHTSIPLVFLTAIWHHSVQILQGGMLLSRVTAITRKALRSLTESLERCRDKQRNEKNRPFFDMSLTKLWCLESKSSFYRNHPFMAGVIVLDLAVDVSIFCGAVTIPFSHYVHRIMHMYNAMVRGGGMQASPLLEKFLAVHARSFFTPTRPSHSFLRAFEQNSPGINESAVSELHRILIQRDGSALTQATFASRVQYVRRVWSREFCDGPTTLAFNFMAFEQELKAVVDDVFAQMPELPKQSWQDRVLFFIGAMDHDMMVLPMRLRRAVPRAMNAFANGLAGLSSVSFDLLPRVAGSMEAAVYGPLAEVSPDPLTKEDHGHFSDVMDVFEDYSGPLSGDEIVKVFTTCRDNPAILGMHDLLHGGPGMLTTGIVNHVAAGPRANSELLECLLQLDGQRVHGPVDPIHACAATGNVDHLELLLSARNYSDRDTVCSQAGNTPLHYAALYGQAEVIEYLSGLFANPNITNKKGKTPMELAKSDAIQRKLMGIHNKHSRECFRVQSRPESVARANERRWSAQARQRADRLQQKLNKRREQKQDVQPITADEEAKAKKAEAELMALLEREEQEREKANGQKKKGRKGGRHNKQRHG